MVSAGRARVVVTLLLGACTYRLAPLPDAAIDADAPPATCDVRQDVSSPSCPSGTGHCGRVRVMLPATWHVGPDLWSDVSGAAQFQVTLTPYAIEMDVYEVDVARWRRFEASGLGTPQTAHYPDGSTFQSTGSAARSDDGSLQTLCTLAADASADALPINCVSWDSANAFCAFDGGRLPTLAEMEYVRRWLEAPDVSPPGTDGRAFPWGDELVSVRFPTGVPARFPQDRMGATPPIDPSEGLRIGCFYGMAGGVAEWLGDTGDRTTSCFDDGFCEIGDDYHFVATGSWLDSDTDWTGSSAASARNRTEASPGHGLRCVYDVAP